MLLARHHVLVLCTGNSARSILGEVLFNELGGQHFRAWSAGSKPQGRVNPFALEVLAQHGHDVAGLHSKGWQTFSEPEAPKLDFVITVCSNAAGEQCPTFPGPARVIHWPLPDPAIYSDTPKRAQEAFARCYREMRLRVEVACRLAAIEHTDQLAQRLQALADTAGLSPIEH